MKSTPPAVRWNRVYCLANVAFYASLTWGAWSVCIGIRSWLDPELYDRNLVGLMAALSGLLTPVAAFGLVSNLGLLALRGPTAYRCHHANIMCGAYSGLFSLPCLPLLRAWEQPDVREHYGVR